MAVKPGCFAIRRDQNLSPNQQLFDITSKGKWERDALPPGIRWFLESHPQKVADWGSDFVGFNGLQNTLA